jgi:hypothetical protein
MGWSKEDLEWCECHLQWFQTGRLEMHVVVNCCALGCAKKNNGQSKGSLLWIPNVTRMTITSHHDYDC